MHRIFAGAYRYSLSVPKVCKTLGIYIERRFSQKTEMRILNVAEKNDAAKTIASILSGGRASKREGLSVYNKIYEFDHEVLNRNSKMIMTSVSGHLLGYDFVGIHRNWTAVNPIALFEAPIRKNCISGYENIKKTLERETKTCNALIIWTDCDREGENIGFEIIDVCRKIKPNLDVYRAKFSEITEKSVLRALRNLELPNKSISDAVDVRMELDLRIGAAFTRLQCLHLKRAFPEALQENLVSYGSCQFPTLGFVVERFKAISEFVPETFWKIDVRHSVDDLNVDFQWKRVHLFNKLACEVITDKCIEHACAKVEKVVSKPKTKWRPRPLDTIELEKTVSKKLRINAKETMKIAEKLYTQGLVSYPRTETNIFPKEMNLVSLVQHQTCDPNWGGFAEKILAHGPNPFQGNKSDLAHPPIHPTKYSNSLSGNDKKIYEFIVRHFLACLSKHAEGLETTVEIDIAEEKFMAKGLMITARNYLDVYPYDKWSDKEINAYREGETFTPEISMNEGQTSPPELLTEADLIALMEKHGIGTDATHAEHIEKIKSRFYVGLHKDRYFVPRTLGMGLVEGYNNMGYEMAKPDLRAELETDLKRICDNEKTPQEVLNRHIMSYKEVFEGVQRQVNRLSETIETYIQVEAVPVDANTRCDHPFQIVKNCPSCNSSMILRTLKDDRLLIGCSNFPGCRESYWLPSMVKEVALINETCPTCGPNTNLLKFKFERGSCYLPTEYVGCIGGCDENLLEILNFTRRPRNETRSNSNGERSTNSFRNVTNSREGPLREVNDSGYDSFNGGSNQSRSVAAETVPMCECNVPALRLIVKKSGPNSGKAFFKCGIQGGRCNYFEWQDENGSNQKRKRQSKINVAIGRRNDDGEERCYCAVQTKRLVVSKDGPNKGREFFTCGKQQAERDKCNFFKWAS